MTETPIGLRPGGRDLWAAIADAHELNAAQAVQLLEACRCKDRLDTLHALMAADITAEDYLGQANRTANMLKQLLAALRLPDEVTGKRPITRPARGAYVTGGKVPGTVSALDRARNRSAG